MRKAYIMLDTRSTGTFMSPIFTKVTNTTITLSEEIAPDQWQLAHITHKTYWLPSPARPKGPCEGSKGEGGVKVTPKKPSKSLEQQLVAIKRKEKMLMELEIPCLRNQWLQKYKNWLGGMVQKLPLLWEVNHNIPLIDNDKHYGYHLPYCTDALKQQLSDKIQLYTDVEWWVMKSVPQATSMLCITKKSRKLWIVIDCCKRNGNTVKDMTLFLDQDQIWINITKAKYCSKFDLSNPYE